MNKKLYILLLGILILIVASCSQLRRDRSEEELLLQHLHKWQSFEMKGIAELSYSHFRLRKNISIQKDTNSLLLTVFESGLYGLKASPILEIQVEEETSLTLAEPLSSLLNDKNIEYKQYSIDDVNNAFKYLVKNKHRIVADRKLATDQFEIAFNDKLQISTISSPSSLGKIELLLTYKNEELPELLSLSVGGETIFKIQIDNIKYR